MEKAHTKHVKNVVLSSCIGLGFGSADLVESCILDWPLLADAESRRLLGAARLFGPARRPVAVLVESW